MTLLYCYDAYCGWCYGFSGVIRAINSEYKGRLDIEVLSGGMILPDKPVHIGVAAAYISDAYKTVEEYTGVKFGESYLWHIKNPQQSDWYPDSRKPAVALCIFKEYFPALQVSFATDLQYALHFEGRDLTDSEAYRHILDKYDFPAEVFYGKLYEKEYEEMADQEFELCKQLQVTGYPTVFLQLNESKFFLLARGYTTFDTLNERIRNCLEQDTG